MPDWKGPKIERMKRSALDITGTGNKREKSKKLSNENKRRHLQKITN